MDGSFKISLLFFHSAILCLLGLITLTMAEPYYISTVCTTTDTTASNYTANSTYQANLNTLLSSMSSYSTLHNGFYNNTAGQDSEKVYGIFLCRGDITSDKCFDCVNTSSHRIIQQCPNQKEAITWYLECMLRYSYRSIFATMDDGSHLSFWGNPTEVRSEVKDNFTQALGGLMNTLMNRVSTGSRIPLFETGEVFYTGFEKIYGLVQCTPDISSRDCKRCLQSAISDLPLCCDGLVAGGSHRTSCSLRFASAAFYDFTDIAPASFPPTTSPSPQPMIIATTGGKKAISTKVIIIVIVISTVVVLILLSIICFILWRRIPKEKINDPLCEDEDVIRSSESLQFDFGAISIATDDFSNANKLGEGGFGAVFKGKLSNGQEIAVKRLCSNSGQGDLEFKNEAVLVAKLQHRNLVRLLGFCLEGEEKLLIYEFVLNASLDYFIFDPVKRAELNWERRYRIIGGITRGLLYLHEDSRLKIIHRDLKASNILLDQDMNPKISDFGTARLFVVDQTRGNTNRIVGTFGYMAPEYAIHGQFSVKSDVFSFGVLLLEIVSGQKSTSFSENGNLLTYAWTKWREGAALELTDSTLRDCLSISEVMRCIHIGLLCVQERVAERPTMASVVLLLNSYAVPLPLPSQPAFYLHSETAPNTPLREYNSQEGELEDSANQSAVLSMNEVSISELSAR